MHESIEICRTSMMYGTNSRTLFAIATRVGRGAA